MGPYVLRRLLLLIPTFLAITAVVFAITRLLPGGPIEAMWTDDPSGVITPTLRAALNERYGLDQPLPNAYLRWLGDLLTGDLGRSFKYNTPVLDEIARRAPTSAWFGSLGFVLAYLVCVPLGLAKAVRHGTPFDLATGALLAVGYSIPGWALGAALLVLFGGGTFLDWFPLGGARSPHWDELSAAGRLADAAHHAALPVLAYTAGSFATLTALVKNSVLDALAADYVRAAYAKGLGPGRVLLAHALRNALVPLCTGLGRALSVLVAGSFLVEKVFNIDGIGYLGYTSLARDFDYPVVMGILVFTAALGLLGNLASDLLYAWADPRVRLDA